MMESFSLQNTSGGEVFTGMHSLQALNYLYG